ncbi:MAG TPA: CARDB domain-containing protein [bacterium]|jgi:hypothetical protein
MKINKIILLALLFAASLSNAYGQDTLYAEYFTGGTPSLTWFDPWVPDSTTLTTRFVTGNPSGDGWVGVVPNTASGGGVGTELSGTSSMTDYEIQAQIFCTISGSSGGAYHAIIARCDTVGGLQFYYLRTDFDTDQRLQLRYYDGTMTGVTIATWTGGQIPGGVPTQDGWHHMALKCQGNQLWAYWDDNLLSGSPFTDSNMSSGYFGAYVFRFTGLAETLFDDVLVLGEAGPQPFDFIAQDNHFLDSNLVEMSLRPAAGQTIYFRLDWDALNGTTTSPSFRNILELDGTPIFQENNPGVEPNTNHTTTSSAWVATLGWHAAEWILDSQNNVIEGNEDNNTLVDSFRVVDPNSYDLQADSTWIADPDTIPYADSVRVGDMVRFVLHWSAPMGSGPSGPFNIVMDLDGQQYFLTTYPGISASGGNYMTLAAPWTAMLGFHYFEWYLDADNWVIEFNEANNSTLDGLTVAPQVGVEWGPPLTYLPQNLRIANIFPNPFNPEVTLRYEIAEPGVVILRVYDVAGRLVTVLADGFHPRGVWDVTWDGSNLAGGTYFAVLEGDGKQSVKALMLVK